MASSSQISMDFVSCVDPENIFPEASIIYNFSFMKMGIFVPQFKFSIEFPLATRIPHSLSFFVLAMRTSVFLSYVIFGMSV